MASFADGSLLPRSYFCTCSIVTNLIWILFVMASYSQLSYSFDVKLNEPIQLSEEHYSSGIAGVLHLERLLPKNHATTIDALVARDRARHARMLQIATNEIVYFPLNSSFDIYNIGIYYTNVKVGTPPQNYNLLIDTGSEISWITCFPCDTCPLTNVLGVKINLYDTGNSTTASSLPCSARDCKCTKANQCGFAVTYADRSNTTGYLVSDVWHLDTVLNTSSTSSSSAPITFGCSTAQYDNMVLEDNSIDGIMGLDGHRLSVTSQLSSHGISPRVFSHCLRRESNGGGGGILVFGEIRNPNMTYTPLVRSMGNYNVDLHSIAVNGEVLQIDPTVFATSNGRGTIFDSGTSLIYLAAEAYDSVISAITTATASYAQSITSGITPCFLISSSSSINVTNTFPQITLNFAGSVSMALRPEDYLSPTGTVNDTIQWCILFLLKGQSLTVLGDIALRDKSIVYDLARHRIGWADQDCSLPVNVSIPSGTDQIIIAREILFNMLESLLCIFLFMW